MDSRVITISTIQQIGLFFCYSCPGRVIRRCKWTIRSIHQIGNWNQYKETIEFVNTPKNCLFPTEQKVSSREMFENCERFQDELDENVVAIWLVSKSRATSINESEQNQPQSPTWLPRTRFPRLEMVAERWSRNSDFIGSFKRPHLFWLDDVWFLIFNIQFYQS